MLNKSNTNNKDNYKASTSIDKSFSNNSKYEEKGFQAKISVQLNENSKNNNKREDKYQKDMKNFSSLHDNMHSNIRKLSDNQNDFSEKISNFSKPTSQKNFYLQEKENNDWSFKGNQSRYSLISKHIKDIQTTLQNLKLSPKIVTSSLRPLHNSEKNLTDRY